MDLALTCIGLLGLLVFGLGLRVSMLRRGTSTGIGCKDDPTDPLFKAVRAHCNACEYTPMLAILIYALASTGSSGWGGLLFVGAVVVRYMHAAGMLMSPTLAEGHPLRVGGAVGTYVVGLLLALGAVF
jgi:uncharacterized membrane protein YecN with MAPEG domain